LRWGDVVHAGTTTIITVNQGRRIRKVYAPLAIRPYLNRWEAMRGEEDGYYFKAVRGTEPYKRVHAQTVFSSFWRLCKNYGLRKFTPRDLYLTWRAAMLDRYEVPEERVDMLSGVLPFYGAPEELIQKWALASGLLIEEARNVGQS
jgi:integrase